MRPRIAIIEEMNGRLSVLVSSIRVDIAFFTENEDGDLQFTHHHNILEQDDKETVAEIWDLIG